MLDIKLMRKEPERVAQAVGRRGKEIDMQPFLTADEKHREVIAQIEELQSQRNAKSKEVGQRKRNGESADDLMAEVSAINEKIKVLDESKDALEKEVRDFVVSIPNMPADDIPDGGEDDYRVERVWGEPRKFDFEPKAHWDLGVDLDILDFDRAAKVTGSRFTFYKGLAARLERAIISFMIDMHTDKHGYTELIPPYMTNSASDFGTGQLPKFAEDMFHLENTDYYLIPTAEVPVTNYHRDEILSEKDLPVKYCAFSPCFRSEAGSAGRDTRGIIRQHQFHKVEMVKLAHPDHSWEELESLTQNAEDILQALELPYRVICLSAGDIGFSSAKTYDLEVWLPSYGKYREISSCSNFLDFQSRRANLRFRDADGKVRFVHTLNGSGLAVGRTLAAILENYQNEDGSVTIPKALVPYMHGYTEIR
ncbi:MAG: serine--tRNA ligase [Peptococcaceae bacterium]|jgi:seryl-tRNA synthetase|nr:serine--tRNA ligase [Peptococcaceae bacterium]MEE0206313.1 serine--tRNA ligase [Peptococcaceae bacterium]